MSSKNIESKIFIDEFGDDFEIIKSRYDEDLVFGIGEIGERNYVQFNKEEAIEIAEYILKIVKGE